MLGGLCPVGRPPDDEGKDGVGGGAAGGWAAAAAPVQGSANAGGATPIATLSPIAAADSTDIDAIRGRGGMSHLSRGGRRVDVGSLADVTIVICVTIVISDPLIGMHP